MTKHNYKAADLKRIKKESVELADELEMLDEAQMLNEAEATVIVPDKKKQDNLVHLCKQVGIKTTVTGNKVHMKGIFRRVMDISLAMQRNGLKVEENDIEEKEYSDAEISEMFGNKVIDPTTAAALRVYLKGKAGGAPFPPVVEGMMSKIDQMQKDGKSTAEIAKALKLDVKVVKGILGEGKDDAYAIGMAAAKKKYNDEPPLDKKTITKGHEIAKSILKKEETIVEFTSQQIKMAYGIANDKRYKGGNYTGAVKAIEKIAKGLSNHPDVRKVLQRTNEEKEHPAKMKYEQIAGLKKKAEKSGMPYGILKKVYDRGMAAWRGGHRPGASQQQWAFARVNSFITKSSGTWGGADKDLAAKVKGGKK